MHRYQQVNYSHCHAERYSFPCWKYSLSCWKILTVLLKNTHCQILSPDNCVMTGGTPLHWAVARGGACQVILNWYLHGFWYWILTLILSEVTLIIRWRCFWSKWSKKAWTSETHRGELVFVVFTLCSCLEQRLFIQTRKFVDFGSVFAWTPNKVVFYNGSKCVTVGHTPAKALLDV